MNQTKIKTVSEERDGAIWLMNKTSLELNRTKAQLAATEEALAQVQRESAELREDRDLNRQRVIELQRESLELRTERDNTLDGLRTAAILLHVSVHYAATGVRWEECEDCKDVRILLPEYAEQPAPARDGIRRATIEECAKIAKQTLDERSFGPLPRIGSLVAERILALAEPPAATTSYQAEAETARF